MADTRKDRRAPVSLKVRFKSATVDEFIEQYSKDVSRGGIFIKSSQPMAVGTLLKFQFQLKDESALIRGVGRVVWTRAEEDAGAERPAGMGIKFIKMDTESKATVDRILDAHGDMPGAYESGRKTATQAEPESTRPPASAHGAHGTGNGSSGGAFFPETTPMNELPAPEDRTAVRHAAQFLASAFSEAASNEADAREAEQKAEEARRRTAQIEAQRAADAERRKRAAGAGEALPSIMIDPSLSLPEAEPAPSERPPSAAASQATYTGLEPVVAKAPTSDAPTQGGNRPSKPPPGKAKRASDPPPAGKAKKSRSSNPPPPAQPSKSVPPPGPKLGKVLPSKPPTSVSGRPPSPEDDTSITDRKNIPRVTSASASDGAPPAPVMRKRSLMPVVVITAAVVIAAFLALRSGNEESKPATPDQMQVQPEPTNVEPKAVEPAPAPAPEPAPTPAPAPEPGTPEGTQGAAPAPEQAPAAEPAPAPEPQAAAPTPAPEPAPAPAPAPEPAPQAAPTPAPAPAAADSKLGKVRVMTTPNGAQVLIDGKVRGKSPLMIDLPKGTTVTVTARMAGHLDASQLVTPGASALEQVRLALTVPPFKLRVETLPEGATVSAGGKRGTSPVELDVAMPAKGALVVSAKLIGYDSATAKVAPTDFTLSGGVMHGSVTLTLMPASAPPPPKPAPPKPEAPKGEAPAGEAPAEAKPAEPPPMPEVPSQNIPDNPF